MIDRAQVAHVAALAKLSLTEAELDAYARELGAIVRYVERIAEMPLEGVSPLAHGGGAVDRFREDAPKDSLPRDVALGSAPDRADLYFRVPRMIAEP
jgi:aspartyl-tRNA(Asn)/glutamyl-tRNA(Gln) amidotransferase subunit C